MRSLFYRHTFTARCARDRRVRRGEIRKDKIKYNPFLCVLSELCGENFILAIARHVYLIMAPLVSESLSWIACRRVEPTGKLKLNEQIAKGS
jgi:hypothetical protein